MSATTSAKAPPQVDLPSDQELVLKVIPMPADCNANGDIFGGWVLWEEWVRWVVWEEWVRWVVWEEWVRWVV